MKIEILEDANRYVGAIARAGGDSTPSHVHEAVTNRIIAAFMANPGDVAGLEIEMYPVGNGQAWPYVYVYGGDGADNTKALRAAVELAEANAPAAFTPNATIAFDDANRVTVTGEDETLVSIRLLADFMELLATEGREDVYAERTGDGLYIEGDAADVMRRAISLTRENLHL